MIRDLSAEAGGAASEPDELPDALAAVEGRVAQLELQRDQAVEAERERVRQVLTTCRGYSVAVCKCGTLLLDALPLVNEDNDGTILCKDCGEPFTSVRMVPRSTILAALDDRKGARSGIERVLDEQRGDPAVPGVDGDRAALDSPQPERYTVEWLEGDKARAVVGDFLSAWQFCPVSQATDAARKCLDDAASQLLAALSAAFLDQKGPTDA